MSFEQELMSARYLAEPDQPDSEEETAWRAPRRKSGLSAQTVCRALSVGVVLVLLSAGSVWVYSNGTSLFDEFLETGGSEQGTRDPAESRFVDPEGSRRAAEATQREIDQQMAGSQRELRRMMDSIESLDGR